MKNNCILLPLAAGIAIGYLLAKKNTAPAVGAVKYFPSGLPEARPVWPFERMWGPHQQQPSRARAANMVV